MRVAVIAIAVVALILVGFFFFGGASPAIIVAPEVAAGRSLKGKVKKKAYHPPENNFIVPVPSGSVPNRPTTVSHLD